MVVPLGLCPINELFLEFGGDLRILPSLTNSTRAATMTVEGAKLAARKRTNSKAELSYFKLEFEENR